MVQKKREPERCQKTKLIGEKLSVACVARRGLVTVEVLFQLTERSSRQFHRGCGQNC